MTDHSHEGCTPVSGGLAITDIQVNIDSDREVEKIHSQFLSNREKLEAMQGNLQSLYCSLIVPVK